MKLCDKLLVVTHFPELIAFFIAAFSVWRSDVGWFEVVCVNSCVLEFLYCYRFIILVNYSDEDLYWKVRVKKNNFNSGIAAIRNNGMLLFSSSDEETMSIHEAWYNLNSLSN